MLAYKNSVARSLAPSALMLCCFLAGCSPEIGGALTTDETPLPDAGTEEECLNSLWYLDVDGDGFGDAFSAMRACEQPVGRVDNGDDCDDESGLINPEALEVCDGIDNNCTGSDTCDDALLAHWDFRESSAYDASDASGNGRNIRLVNGSWVTGDAIIRFDGVDDYAEALHHDDFELENGTVSFWALSNAAATRQGLWSKDSDGLDAGGHLQIEFLDDDTVQVRLQSPTASMRVVSAPLARDEWHHVAFTFGVRGMRLYIDGALTAFDSYGGGIENNSEPIAIGSNTSISDDGLTTPTMSPLSGEMANVRMYSRALHDDEIGYLFELDAR